MRKPLEIHVSRPYDSCASICCQVRVERVDRTKPLRERRMVPLSEAHLATCRGCLRRIEMHDIRGAA